MNRTRKFLSVFSQIILLIVLVATGYYLYDNYFNPASQLAEPLHLPTSPSSLPIPDVYATQLSEGGNPIPTVELAYIRVGNISGLQTYMDSQAKNWLNISTNIHSQDIYGAGQSSITIQNKACDLTWPLSELCRYATVEYTAIYKGIMTGGTKADFVLHPTVTLGDDWTEIDRIQEGNKITITQAATATVTFSGEICVTSIEESTPTSVEYGQYPPLDNSYTIKTKDERLLPDIGPWVYDLDVNEEFLRIDSYKKAKDIALLPEKVSALYSWIEADMRPGGQFYEAVKSFYTPELAQLYSLKGWIIVMNPSRGNPLVRCDGTYVNR